MTDDSAITVASNFQRTKKKYVRKIKKVEKFHHLENQIEASKQT